MTEEELRRLMDKLIDSETESLQTLIKRMQRLLYDSTTQSIDTLDLGFDVTGKTIIQNNLANTKKIGTLINSRMAKVVAQSKPSLFKRIFSVFKRIIAYTITGKVLQGYEITEEDIKDIEGKIFFRYGLNPQTGEIIKGSYFDAIFDVNPVSSRVVNDMYKAMQSGQGLEDFKRQFRSVFLGQTNNGYLEQYFTRWSQDLYMQADAVANLEMANRLGQNHAIYAGTEKDNTRCFCIERMNRVYTREEMIGWNRLTWRGKIPNGNVLIDRGGYNCRHTLNWISDELAPLLNKPINEYGVC
jgi:hypothetical protein